MAQVTDVAAVRHTIAEAGRHQNDVEPFIALQTADALIVNIAGRRVLGRDAIHQAMTAAMASPLADVRTTVEIEDIRFATPDVAIVSCLKHVSDQRQAKDAGDVLPQRGALTYIVVRDGDTWLIAAAQTTPILGA